MVVKWRWRSPWRRLNSLDLANRTKSSALEKRQGRGAQFRTLTQSGRTLVILDRGAEAILWDTEGRATRPFRRGSPTA